MVPTEYAAGGDHTFQPATDKDSRCPCPALNSLANHGYLPRNGRAIGLGQLVSSLREVYNLSYPLAIFLSVAGMLLCGQWWSLPWRLDLHDLARHNRIEHNCSLVHDDAKDGAVYAPNHVNFTLLCRLLRLAKQDHLTMADFVQARILRAKEDSEKPLDTVHKEIAHGEAALTMLVMGSKPSDGQNSSITVPRAFVKQWFGEDRLPDGWRKPSREVGFWDARSVSGLIRDAIISRDYMAKCA